MKHCGMAVRLFLVPAFLAVQAAPALADGTEALGAPLIPVAAGSGIVMEGVGLATAQPGVINLQVPAGAVVKQVLLYWEGQSSSPAPDSTITVNGTEVTGTRIGGPTLFYYAGGIPHYTSTLRADITALNAVSPGVNAVSVGGLTFNRVSNGAGILVIYDNGPEAQIRLVDGNDCAYRFFAPPLNTTAERTFAFDPAPVDRTAPLAMFFSSVQGTASTGGPQRPNRISITVGGVTTNYDDVLNSNDGEEWDTWTVDLTIPAGAAALTVQAISGPGGDQDPNTPDPRPASFTWMSTSLAVPIPCTGLIGDFVWKDADCDGLQEPGEPGIAGVTVKLLDGTGAVIATTVTTGDGAYLFTGLCAGTYGVMVDASTLPPGYIPTACSNAPGIPGNSNCSPSPVVLADYQADRTIDFGYCEPQGGEGCTPGYWKQSQHFSSWPAPFTPGTPFSAVFENAFPGRTLLQVLKLGGGGLNALGRHTVAALLNSASAGVSYTLTPSAVIAMFNGVYPGGGTAYETLKDVFEDYNEQGCPLSKGAIPDEEIPEGSRLYQNYPNPFNPATEIYFRLQEPGRVTIRVFDALGQEVRTLLDGPMEAGFHGVTWNATDKEGRAVTSGIYFCQLTTGGSTEVRKMSLLR
ncbi:MAG: SdrD B-like domain-containing protein [Bacteroidota bacterium]